MLSYDSMFAIRLSAQVAMVATFVLIVATIPLAYAFARKSFLGKRLLETLFMLPLVLPPTVLGYYLVMLFGRKGVVGGPIFEATGWSVIFSWWGAVVAAVVVAFPLLFRTAYAALAGVDRSLEQTAHTLGKSKIETFRRITIPLASRGLLSGITLAFARAMGEFGATLMLAGNIPGRTNTMPLTIYSAFAAGNFDQANVLAAIYVVSSALVLGIVSLLSRNSCYAPDRLGSGPES